MIIWSRWGILVFAFFGLGIGLGFIIMSIFGLVEKSGARNGIFVGLGIMLSGALLWFCVKTLVGKHIDKPRMATVLEQLPEPITHANGAKQTHRAVPVLHPTTGQPIWTQPVSTLFFIPVKYWAYLLPAIGLLILVINLVVVLAGGR